MENKTPETSEASTKASPTSETKRKRSQTIRGVVVSDKMNKTRVIQIKRTVSHGLYYKTQVKGTKLFIHDETNQSKIGDLVIAVATRPLSRNKSFRLVKVVQARVAE
jgi:small subunit ribosomal protein S17